MDVNEVLLPGVGLRYEFVNREGDRIGVVALRSGEFELVVYERVDPDQARAVLRLTEEEADTLAEILGAPRIAERFADLAKEVPGLSAGQVEVRTEGPFAGRPSGETRARTRTGASVVAIVRGEEVIPSPGPGQVLRAGDVLVVIGTRDGIAAVGQRETSRQRPEQYLRRRGHPGRTVTDRSGNELDKVGDLITDEEERKVRFLLQGLTSSAHTASASTCDRISDPRLVVGPGQAVARHGAPSSPTPTCTAASTPSTPCSTMVGAVPPGIHAEVSRAARLAR